MRWFALLFLLTLPGLVDADPLPNSTLSAGCIQAGGVGGPLISNPCGGLAISGNLITDGTNFWSEVAPAGPVPLLSSFTQENVGSSIMSQKGGAGFPILFQLADSASVNRRWLAASLPSPPFSIIAQYHCLLSSTGATTSCSLAFRNNSGASLIWGYGSTGTSTTEILGVSSVTSDTAASTALYTYPTSLNQLVGSPLVELRLRDDGTDLYFDYSLDGNNFVNAYSEAIGTHITPTLYALGGNCSTSTSATPCIVDIVSVQILNNANP